MGRKKRGWKAASGLSLDELRRMVASKQADLTERRAALASELEAIDADLGNADEGPAAEPAKRRGRPRKSGRGPGRPPKKGRGPGRPKGKVGRPAGMRRPGRPAGTKGQSDLHNAIREALRGSTEPMKLADIADKVKSGGYKTKSKNFAVILGLRVSEMPDVKRVERGIYAIKG